MTPLLTYLANNSIRRESAGAEVDVMFFGVNKRPSATAEGLQSAMAQHKGEFCEVDPFDGKEHNYLELGGWVGDQGAALELIGLGAALGMWKALTPKSVFGDLIPADLAMQMAGAGMVALQVRA